jgi:hypothetical protein
MLACCPHHSAQMRVKRYPELGVSTCRRIGNIGGSKRHMASCNTFGVLLTSSAYFFLSITLILYSPFLMFFTERRGLVVKNPASYSGGPGDRLS